MGIGQAHSSPYQGTNGTNDCANVASVQEPNNFSQPDFGPERCTDDGHTNQHPVDGPELRSELKPVLLGAINTPAAAAVLY